MRSPSTYTYVRCFSSVAWIANPQNKSLSSTFYSVETAAAFAEAPPVAESDSDSESSDSESAIDTDQGGDTEEAE